MNYERLDALLTLEAKPHPDSVDVFEDFLAARLGLIRHPGLDLPAWHRVRDAFIGATGDRANRLGGELADKLLDAPEDDRP